MRLFRLFCIVWFIGCAALVCVFAGQVEAPRESMPLQEGWRFFRGSSSDAQIVNFDDSSWERVRVPHTWNAADGEDGGGYYRGDGWYRRHVFVPATWAGKQVYFQSEGANRSAVVYLNGKQLGEHRGGAARFRFNATSALVLGADNVLAVRVNNGEHDGIAPELGDFTLFGGLYRDVSFLVTAPVQIETLNRASSGVFVTTEHLSSDKADLSLRIELSNHLANAQQVLVRAHITDAAGTDVLHEEAGLEIEGGSRSTVVRSLRIPTPHFWNGRQDPFLYQARIEVCVDGQVMDRVVEPFGLRTFSIDAEKGVFLNGRPFELRGANRSQDRHGLGWAISEAEDREDMNLLMEMGCTMDRTAHSQQSPLWYGLADQLGVVLWTEVPFVYDVVDTPAFFENTKEQLRELIRQNYNHPSILCWGIGNETFVRDKQVTRADASDRLIRELDAVAKEEDPSRFTTYASNGDVLEPRANSSDLVGFNHYFGWYDAEPEDFATWLDKQHVLRPKLKIGMSEYGAGANPEHHEEPARHPSAPGSWHPEEWQSHFHEVYLQALDKRPWLWCKLVWCMFDLASDGRNEGGTPGHNDKGLVTHDRKIKKDAFYFYKANWGADPVLYITSRRFIKRTQPITPVKVYSNADKVELFVNGQSQGIQSSMNHIFRWDRIQLIPGDNRILVRSVAQNRFMEDSCDWSLTP